MFVGWGEGVVERPYASVTLALLHMSLTPIVVAVVAVVAVCQNPRTIVHRIQDRRIFVQTRIQIQTQIRRC